MIKYLNRTLCSVGIHKWSYTVYNSPPKKHEYFNTDHIHDLIINLVNDVESKQQSVEYTYRTCKRCNKKQRNLYGVKWLDVKLDQCEIRELKLKSIFDK